MIKKLKDQEYSLVADHERFKWVLKEASALRWRKLNDYGASYKTFGSLGVVIRMGDKLRRIERLLQNPKAGKVKDESVRDTLIDILNYAAMGIMMVDQERK